MSGIQPCYLGQCEEELMCIVIKCSGLIGASKVAEVVVVYWWTEAPVDSLRKIEGMLDALFPAPI